MSFFTYVCSSTSSKYYPLNRSSNFRLKLPCKVDGSSYDVALLSIGYNNTRSIFEKDSDRIITICFNGEAHSILIPQQKYSSIRELVICINELISDYTSTIRFSVDDFNKVCIKSVLSDVTISRRLAQILGMEDTIFPDATRYGKHEASLDNINNDVFILMDSVVPQFVGTKSVPYLNICRPSNSSSATEVFFRPLYVPLSPHIVDSVVFRLVDCMGKEVELSGTEPRLHLHFRFKNGDRNF